MIIKTKCLRILCFMSAAMLLFLATNLRGEESAVSLIWEKKSYPIAKGQSLSDIAGKWHMTPAALRIFNGLPKSIIRPDKVINFPQIAQIVFAPDEAGNKSAVFDVRSYKIYAANEACYAMLYAAAENNGPGEQLLAIFLYKDNEWVEQDRIEFIHPASFNLDHRLKNLTPDKVGNEGACFYLEYYWSSKTVGVDGIGHVPAVSKKLHGHRMVLEVTGYGATREDENLPPFSLQKTNIGAEWPDELLYLRSSMERNQRRLLEFDP